jgi:glutamate 5-kinase
VPRKVLRRAKRVVIKIGSRLLAPGGELDRKFIGALAKGTAELVRGGREVLIVSSGSIAAGLKPLGLSRRPGDLPLLQAAAAVGQGMLMHAYQIAFGRRDLVAAQILITRDGLEDRQRYLNARNTVLALLKKKAVPVINENDTVSVDEIRFGDNDTLSALVASFSGADLLIMLTDVAGLLDENGNVVPRVEKVDAAVRALVDSSKTVEGVGGMSTKLDAALIGQKGGFHTIVAPGRENDVLARVLDGEELGTWFVAGEERPAARKQWLAFSQKSEGKIVIDDGAVKALVESKKSLLPSGIVRAEGRFRAGAGVAITTKRGREVARGISNYSATDIEKIKGKKTSELAAVVGKAHFDEVVHRDNLTVV